MTEREYQRARLVAEVVVMNGATPDVGRAVNISLGGMYMRLGHPRPLGSVLELTITLPPNKRFRAKGRVVRASTFGGEELPAAIAVKFEDLPVEGKTEIEAYVRRTARVLRALFFELNKARINEARINELILKSPIEHQYPLDILREKVTSELANLRLRAGHQFRK